MFNAEFLLTSLVVVLIPGAGVIYTVSTGLFLGWRASVAAAVEFMIEENIPEVVSQTIPQHLEPQDLVLNIDIENNRLRELDWDISKYRREVENPIGEE